MNSDSFDLTPRKPGARTTPHTGSTFQFHSPQSKIDIVNMLVFLIRPQQREIGAGLQNSRMRGQLCDGF